jgi:hypothetical protein
MLRPVNTNSTCARSDADGNMQPMEQGWNFGSYGNNGVQRVRVIAR